MTRSIFDPTNPRVERSGSPFLGEAGENRSHMPEDAVDGVVNDDIDMGDAMGEHPTLPGNVERIDENKASPR